MKRTTFIAVLCTIYYSIAFSSASAQGTISQQPKVEAYPLSNVRLLEGSKWRDNQRLDSAWICSFPVNRLLHSFRTTAGAYSAYEGGYSGKKKIEKLGGWESMDCDLRGHAIGHLLSAYALMYVSCPSSENIFKFKGDSLVAGLRECQQMMGTGYLSAFPEGLLKRNLRGGSVWAPWYTIHKILAGLTLQYRLTGNETAMAICRDFTQWADTFLSDENLRKYIDEKAPDTEAVHQRMLRNEFGGIGEAFYDIYTITGDAKALRLSNFFYHKDKLDPLYAGNFDMGTMHCNTFLPKVICEAKKDGAAMADRFWHEMIAHHVLAPGCMSDKEHFFNPAETSKHLTGNTGETCCTYNMLKLTRELYARNPNDPAYFDYYERGLYNHILGQQDPATGMVHYFLPTQTGAYKLYSTYDKSFWCCVGSSYESHAKYGESIYWHNTTNGRDTVYVNLFIPSTLTADGIDIKMVTDFPDSNKVNITVNTQRALTLMVRQPSWTGKSGYRIYNIRRGIKNISLSLPMSLHTEATPDNANRKALFYGPVLLAGQLGTEGMDCWSDPSKHNDYYGYDYKVPEAIKRVSLNTNGIKQTAPLEWTTTDGITIKPLYDTHRQRYVVYWE